MIDLIECLRLPVRFQSLERGTRDLIFYRSDTTADGEIQEDRKQHATFNSLLFSIRSKPELCQLKGSLHKYANGGRHNYDDFSYDRLVLVISDLYRRFGINPFLTPINNIEFGVNLRVPYPPEDILKNLIVHNRVGFQDMDIRDVGNGRGKRCRHSQYIIKIYDKGLQYGQGSNLLRVEIHVDTMQFLCTNGLKIRTLSDLLIIENLQRLSVILVKKFSEIIFSDDSIIIENLPHNDQVIFLQGSNPNHWGTFTDGNKADSFVRSFKRIIRQNALRHYSLAIQPLIVEKCRQLLMPSAGVQDAVKHVLDSRNPDLLLRLLSEV